MEILNKLQALSESLGQGKDIVEQVKSDLDVALQAKFEEGKAVGYAEGFAAGVASVPVAGEVPPPSDKIFSQADLDVEIQKAKDLYIAELEVKLDAALQQEVIDLKSALFKKPDAVLEVPAEPVV